MKLSNYQWAVVYALRAEPDYRFLSEERTAAEGLRRRRVLRRRSNNRYAFRVGVESRLFPVSRANA